MARLPQPGADDGTWGDILNAYLSVSHKDNGTLKDDVVTAAAIDDATIPEAKLDAALQAKVNGLGSDPAVGGDLTGTASNAQIASGAVDATALASNAVTTVKITDANVTAAKLASDSVTEPKLAASNAPGTNNVLSWDGTNLTWAAAGSGTTNLTSTPTATDVTVESSTGTDATLAAASPTDAGVMTAADKTKLNSVASGATANQTDAFLLARANHTGTQAISTVTSLQADLDAKADETITVTGATSLTGGGDLTANRTLSLVNDAGTPGNSRYYGTDGIGTKGYYVIPAQDPTMGGDLSGTASNAQIAAGAIVNADVSGSAAIAQSKVASLTSDLSAKEPTITAGTTGEYWRGDKSWQTLNKTAVGLANADNTSDANKPVSSATQTALNLKLDDKNETVTLTDSTNDKFARVDINDDTSPTGGWTDRLAFYFTGTRTGYHNEYGELRARPAKISTVALRAMRWNGASTVPIFEVTNSGQTATYFEVTPTAVNATVNVATTGTIAATGTVTGSNIGAKVTTSATAPSSPAVGDVWVDTST